MADSSSQRTHKDREIKKIIDQIRREYNFYRRGKTPKKKNAAQTDPVEVYCRIRPLENPDNPTCIKALSDSVVQLIPALNNERVTRNGQAKEYQYTFQYVFDEYSSQKKIFDYVAMPLMEDLINGKNGLLFSYGITSSGKTYTMTGMPQDQGILPRCLDVLFNSIEGLQAKKYVFKPDRMNGYEVHSEVDAMIERQKKDILPGMTTPKTPSSARHRDGYEMEDHGRVEDGDRVDGVDEDNNYTVFVSYTEIYNNYVYDLLEELPWDPIVGYKPPQSKLLRTDCQDTMYVMNCVEVECKSTQEALNILYRGQKRRKVAHTALNAESSRSHSIFNIRLVQAPLDPRGEEVLQDADKVCISQLSLVDLAGSERCHRTGNMGDRLKEAGNINQSLMVLKTCMKLLRENQKNNENKMVPYRDSKLTHLFKNYFDGDGKVRMIVCINPRAEEYDETIHVMKFAELTQEVMVARSEQVKFDIGLTPGRRRMNQQYQEALAHIPLIDEEVPVIQPMSYSMGPSFPSLEVIHSRDDYTLNQLQNFLEDRYKRRETLLMDYSRKQEQFRSQLVVFEKEYSAAKFKNTELQASLDKKESYIQKLESRLRSIDKKNEEMTKTLKVSERDRRELDAKLQDKNVKIRQERSEKERLKNDFRNRLEMNNQHWEKNLVKEKHKIESEFGGQIWEKQKKLNLLRSIVNDKDAAVEEPRGGFRTPAPKPRTYTTPGKIMTAKSETDISSVGTNSTPRTRTATGTVSSARAAYQQRIATSQATRNTPVYNPRHRRSRSSNAEIWLDHKPAGNVELGKDGFFEYTVLQPKMKKKKSVTKLEVKDTKEASKYCLTHQQMDSGGELETRLVKGDVMPTAGGGTAVVFTDVESLKQKSPGTRKRRSSCPQPTDYEGDWTDTEDRCRVAIEGHGKKRSRGTERESRV
ncbi:kinesin-like protein KIF23 isoform X2 [Mizuhopecten yessoensis]|uniref:kinesin-like protein KIF23 isoform X2 n=1 Tax=Mizuhopecten yessoensis TaxID=6573 RepID=UPI000B45F4DE|nr:kinesin-like protein KIF23 isoform X2 [Mizuhopecten yessoensis]